MGWREIFPEFARPGSRAAAAAMMLSASLVYATQAKAQGGGCDSLAAEIRDGLGYSVAINSADQTVDIRTDKGDCRESVDTWVARKLPISSTSDSAPETGTPKISLPLGDDGLIAAPPDESLAPPPLIPEGALGAPSEEDSLAPPSMIPRGMLKRPPTKEEIEATAAANEAIFAARAAKAAAANAAALESEATATDEPATETKACSKNLEDFWQEGEHDIRGTMYWLAGISTMDTDNDGQVDNVSFKIKSKGHVDNVIRYFGTGRLSGQSVSTLRLKDDRDVGRLCAGTLTFAEPKAEEEKAEAPPPKKKPKKVDAPDDSGKLTISDSTLRENKHWFAIFGVIFLVSGGFGFFRTLKTMDKEKRKKAAIASAKAAPA